MSAGFPATATTEGVEIEFYDYLVVGGGMTADAAVRGIRSVDETGSIGVISSEPDPPYDRPPLSKGLWKEMDEEKIWRGTESLGCHLLLGRTVVSLDREARTVSDQEGNPYGYDHLLLATGAEPRTLSQSSDHVNYFRTYRDFQRLSEAVGRHRRFAVIGGGFIGSEIAAALAMNGKDVVILFPEMGLCESALPPSLARSLNEYFEERGVEVQAGALVDSVQGSSAEGFTVALEDGGAVEAHFVVAGLGVRPRVELARAAGLPVNDGIVTDETFQTSDPRIWAAGDVARFPSSVLDRSQRVEHEDHANSSGVRAGQGMAGEPSKYDYVPFFYSDLFELSYEAVGLVDPSLEMVGDVSDARDEGTVYYLEEGRVRGVLLWNRRGKVRDARQLLREEGPFSAGDLKGRI